MSNWFWYVPGAAVVGGYGYFYFRNYRRRTAELDAAVQERGWKYAEQPPGLLGRCHGVPFRHGRRPRAWHEITGEYRERPFSAFEYSEVIGSSDPDSSERPEREFLRVFGVRLPGRVPDVTVTPRSAVGRLAHQLGAPTGKTGNVDFDRRWTVHADGPDAIRTLLPAELLTWFTSTKVTQQAFRFRAGEVICWEPGRIQLDRVEPSLDYLHDLLAHVPAALTS
jgi:hypothetical protein